MSYSDTGLFGLLIATQRETAARLVESAVKVLKNGNVTDEDVVRGKYLVICCINISMFNVNLTGKNLLKTNLLLESESGTNAILNIGTQAALTGQPQSGSQIAATIDSVSTSDVRNVSTYFIICMVFCIFP